jgi:lariat debranching enzyme
MTLLTRSPSENPLLLAVGDIHGHWEIVAHHAAAARKIYGRLDGVISVGDAQAFRNETEVRGLHCPPKYRTIGDFPRALTGEINIGAPVWFIGGNHEPWPALDAAGAGEWAPGVTFLGRAGVTEILGLNVAFLSGIYSPRVSEGSAQGRVSVKERTYWVREELDLVAGTEAPVDVLITHDWPAGIGTDRQGSATGHPDVARLTTTLRPEIHLCGHMHHRLTADLEGVRVDALGHIRSGGDASLVFQWTPHGIVIHDPLPIARLPRA